MAKPRSAIKTPCAWCKRDNRAPLAGKVPLGQPVGVQEPVDRARPVLVDRARPLLVDRARPVLVDRARPVLVDKVPLVLGVRVPLVLVVRVPLVLVVRAPLVLVDRVPLVLVGKVPTVDGLVLAGKAPVGLDRDPLGTARQVVTVPRPVNDQPEGKANGRPVLRKAGPAREATRNQHRLALHSHAPAISPLSRRNGGGVGEGGSLLESRTPAQIWRAISPAVIP